MLGFKGSTIPSSENGNIYTQIGNIIQLLVAYYSTCYFIFADYG